MIDLQIDPQQTRKTLTDFIRRETQRAGYSRAVIGLSGGVDSALAGSLAVEALGRENVLGVRMPYRTSSPASLEHAQQVIDLLGVASLTIPITEMVDAYLQQFPEANHIRRGNVMARARMIAVFDQSQAFNGLVVGTGNKTEFLLGYTTLYGDAACSYAPIADLYKTQVRQLSRAMGVPEEIIQKPPSADLWEGQTDEGELGFTYTEMDQLLHLWVDQGYSPEECVRAGFAEAMVRTVTERVRRMHFKRSAPPIAWMSNHRPDLTALKDWTS